MVPDARDKFFITVNLKTEQLWIIKPTNGYFSRS